MESQSFPRTDEIFSSSQLAFPKIAQKNLKGEPNTLGGKSFRPLASKVSFFRSLPNPHVHIWGFKHGTTGKSENPPPYNDPGQGCISVDTAPIRLTISCFISQSNTTFSSWDPWPQTWRCWLASTSHTTANGPIDAEGNGLMKPTEPHHLQRAERQFQSP